MNKLLVLTVRNKRSIRTVGTLWARLVWNSIAIYFNAYNSVSL